MAKITFIQTIQQPFLGVFYLCGTLRHFGHKFSTIVSNNTNEICRLIEEYKPDVLGFSVYSGYHVNILKTIKEIKSKFDIPTILGGPHATFFPDVIKSEGVDIVCRGEGEFALAELMNRIGEGRDYSDIKNLIVKQSNGEIIENDVRELVNPLDEIPIPDFSVYKDYPTIMEQLQPLVVASRGCPYSCTYCYNDKNRLLYKGKGKYVRILSPDRVIEEIKEALKVFPKAKMVDFPGDVFGIDYKWLEELMEKYKKEIDLPFSCSYRPEMINERRTQLLASGGCHYIAFGIESGSERVRKEILKRNYTNENIIEAANILRKYGIKFRAYNMVGLPTETIDEIWETIDLNIKIKPDMPWCSFFTPYPGTTLAEMASELNLLPANYGVDDLPTNFHLRSLLKISDRNYVINAHHLFQSTMLFPMLKSFWKILMKFLPNKLTELWFKAIFLYCRIKSDKPRNLFKYIYSMVTSRK